MKTVVALLLAWVVSVSTVAAEERGSTITRSQILAVLKEHRVPGLGVCIVRDGRIVQIETEGLRKLGSDNAMGREDLFHIGSCTKFMTACLAQIAVQEGRLAWDATLGQLGNSLDLRVHPNLKDIDLEQLIMCTSGLPEDREPSVWPDGLLSDLYAFNDNPRAGRRLLARTRLKNAGEVVRDGKYRYSNLGYCLAGVFIEEAYDRPFEDLMREKIFVPLEMNSAGFGAPVWIDAQKQPWGHSGGRPAPAGREADNPLAIGPAGTVRMNLEDMGRYLQFVLGRSEILPQTTLRQLLQPPANSEFARGWLSRERDWAKGRIWLTTGSNTYFFTMFLVAPNIGFAVAVSVNSGDDAAAKACQDVVTCAVEGLKAIPDRGKGE